jgi:hypothetical protein
MKEKNIRDSGGTRIILVALGGMLLGAVLGFCGGRFADSFSPLSRSPEYLGTGGMVGRIIGAVVSTFIVLFYLVCIILAVARPTKCKLIPSR